jgi:anti-sigma regulatory factor (Ser/Thr protein kinase)
VTDVADAVSDRVETVLPPTAASPGVARRFVGAALRRWNADTPTIEAAQLLVSELVTNVVVHTSSEVRLAVSMRGEKIRVEVTDDDDRLPEMRAGAPEAPGGRGLGIVDGIADAWGADQRRDGKAVWFELAH